MVSTMALEAWLGDEPRAESAIAVVADADLHALVEIDPADAFEKAVDEVLACLLAVADDVDAAILLQLQRQDGGIALAGIELGAREPPGCPQLLRLGEPGGLRQAACDRCWKHWHLTRSRLVE
jgi:hypothetical protein